MRYFVMPKRETLMTNMAKRDSEMGPKLRDFLTFLICSEWAEEKEEVESRKGESNL
jgi:hypothetical protein